MKYIFKDNISKEMLAIKDTIYQVLTVLWTSLCTLYYLILLITL